MSSVSVLHLDRVWRCRAVTHRMLSPFFLTDGSAVPVDRLCIVLGFALFQTGSLSNAERFHDISGDHWKRRPDW